MVLFAAEDSGSLLQKFDLLLGRAGRYWKVARLVFVDSLWRFRSKLVLLLAVSMTALALQAAALAIFVVYARRLESGAKLEFAGMTIDPAASSSLLAAAIVAGGTLAVASSFMRMYVERGFYDVTWRYGLYCSERLLALASSAFRQMGGSIRLKESEIRQMALGRSVLCARVLNRLITSLPPAASLIVYSGFLLYLDPLLTLLVLLIVLASSFFFYGLSVHASRFISLREDKARAMSADYRRLIEFMRISNRPVSSDHPLMQRLVRYGSFAEFFEQRFRPQILAAHSMFGGAIMLAAVLVVVGLVKGGEIIVTGTGFGDLIVFLIAGRLAMSSVTGIMNALVRINLYYPKVADYFRMVELLQKAVSAPVTPDGVAPGQTIWIVAKPLGDQAETRAPQVRPGERLGLIAPKSVDHFALIGAVEVLRASQGGAELGGQRIAPGMCWIVADAPQAPFLSFADITGLPPRTVRAVLIGELKDMGFSPEAAETVPEDFDAAMEGAAWDRLDANVRRGAALIAAGHAKRLIVAVGVETLDAIGEAANCAAPEGIFADRIVLIVYQSKDAARAGVFGERYTLLFDGEVLLGYLPVEEVKSRLDFIKGMERMRSAKPADEVLGDDEE